MKNTVRLKRFQHRGSSCIGLFFSYDESLKIQVRRIPGMRFSSTNKCFYTIDTEENLRLILTSLRDYADIDISALSAVKERAEMKSASDPFPGTGKNEELLPVKAVRNDAAGSRTDPERPSDAAEVKPVTDAQPVRKSKAVVFSINESTGSLIIRLPIPYKKEWVDELKSYRARFDAIAKVWILPWTKLNGDSLADYFSRAGVETEVRKERVNDELRDERRKVGDNIRERPLGRKALDGLDDLGNYLDENRYSPRTREAYISMMEFFFRYFSEKEPDEISSEEISEFIYEIIIKLGYSPAYQNQMISAIKTYYFASGCGEPKFEVPGRPRRKRALPNTFSKEEVGRILNATTNMKHKLLLWIIYSCGLRRSEVINIKLSDIDRDRSLIHIREGKGKVDRIVPVSDKVWSKLNDYLAGYSPQVYLFEGQAGGKYSSESVYRVFKNSLRRAGINKDTGVHSLRHSYATHLHENGLDIRYIQELLGHKSTRTTEIYTHVSRRNLIAIRSPIEDLDVR